MAGIVGLIVKQGVPVSQQHVQAFQRMSGKIAISAQQRKSEYQGSSVLCASVASLSDSRNDQFLHDEIMRIVCAVEGMVYVSKEERLAVERVFNLEALDADINYLPYLYRHHGTDLVHHLTGWYNIFIHDAYSGRSNLFNDRLGYLPLYVFENDELFLFSSKIEAILSSKLVGKIEFDTCSVAEYLLFNFTLSDNTFIKGVYTLGNASLLEFSTSCTAKKKYWSASELMDHPSMNEPDSIALLSQGLNDALDKMCESGKGFLYLSLTGGWDSRLVLACLIAKHRERLRLYSFGAPGSPDVDIPSMIARKEGLDYRAFPLDQDYLDTEFLSAAQKTIMLSNGTRHYKRAHYVFAAEKLSSKPGILVSGIYGDQALKVVKPQGGEVLSASTIDLIDSGFEPSRVIERFHGSSCLDGLLVNHEDLKDELSHRLCKVGSQFADYENLSQKFFAFRYGINLRKYFGAEVNSYNDYAQSFSPFIDYDFLQAFSCTVYFSPRYDYFDSSMRLKKQSSQLYYKLMEMNYKPLTAYSTARGYSVRDVASVFGWAKILGAKNIPKHKLVDGYNTRKTDRIFEKSLDNVQPTLFSVGSSEVPGIYAKNTTKELSLSYWWNEILERFG